MSNTPLPGAAAILKWLFIIFNAIFALFGLALIAVGAWLIATGSSFNFILNNGIIGGAALIIMCGGITFVLAAIGVVGAICQNRVILIVFAICLAIIVILEIVGAILGFVFHDIVVSQFNTTLTSGIQEYLTDEALRTVIDATQSRFMCCGVNNYTDWVGTAFYNMNSNQFPQSCCQNATEVCRATATSLHNAGCVDAAETLISDNIGYAIALGVVGLVVGLLEIAGIVLSLALCICIHKSKLTEV